jgi:glutamate N-acetyltransferase/amino-acid N-acetyltransferase
MGKPLSVSPLAPAAFPAIPPVAGARWASVAAGIRYPDRPDLMLLEVADGSSVAGVLTRSSTAGHPVTWCRQVLESGLGRALLVNAGNANVFRGAEGDAAVRAEAEAVAAALGCPAESVLIASTGVIGERLPVERITSRVGELAAALDPHGIGVAARAIMTTDTFAKGAAATARLHGREITIAGIAKGSGMIAPDMATMLAFVVTDAAVAPAVLRGVLAAGADRSFNAITVDSDTSTSDTLLLFATGAAGNRLIEAADDPALAGFIIALNRVLLDLALQVVRDGEGAQKLIAIQVEGALDAAAARRIGLTIANSPLVKTAIAGADANWGRVVAAVGRSGERIDLARLGVAFGGHAVARDGAAVADLDEAPIAAHLRGQEIDIRVTVGSGPGAATVWTCDLTHGYIDINADYRS